MSAGADPAAWPEGLVAAYPSLTELPCELRALSAGDVRPE
jgi:hypothetical protein